MRRAPTRRRSAARRLWVRTVVVVLVVLWSVGCGGEGAGLPISSLPGALTDADDGALIASGTIQAQTVRIATELGGRIQMVAVKEGDTVTSGDLLISLDATPWELKLGPAEAAVEVARAELVALQAGPRDEEIAAAEAALMMSEAKRDGAYDAWQLALAVIEDPQELDNRIVDAQSQVALAEQGVEMMEAKLQPATINWEIRSDGSTEQKSAEYQLRAAEHALAAAQADLVTAKTLLQYLWWIRGDPLAYIARANAAEGQYRVAQAEVVVAQARLVDLQAGPSDEEVAVAEATVARSEAEADLLRLKIERCQLTSPISGVVTSEVLDIGELAAPAATILELADLSEVTLEVYVPENRVGQVMLGQAVTVTVDSFPGQAFTGSVVKIGDEPEYTPRNVATVEERLNTFYAVEIVLSNPGEALKPGMPADARF